MASSSVQLGSLSLATSHSPLSFGKGIESRGLQVKEGKTRLGSGWPARYAVNERAQSGLALIHILAALGYDWGLQVLLPLGAELNLQVKSLY